MWWPVGSCCWCARRLLTRFLTGLLESFLTTLLKILLTSLLTSLLTKVLVQVKAKATVDEGAACNGVNVGVVIGVELVEVVAREVPQ